MAARRYIMTAGQPGRRSKRKPEGGRRGAAAGHSSEIADRGPRRPPDCPGRLCLQLNTQLGGRSARARHYRHPNSASKPLRARPGPQAPVPGGEDEAMRPGKEAPPPGPQPVHSHAVGHEVLRASAHVPRNESPSNAIPARCPGSAWRRARCRRVRPVSAVLRRASAGGGPATEPERTSRRARADPGVTGETRRQPLRRARGGQGAARCRRS